MARAALNESSFDIAVVGAGIVGAACAREFADAGLRTALIEPGVVGGGATAAGMGHIAVMDDSEAQFALTRYSQILWKQLAERLPADGEYVRCGLSGWLPMKRKWPRFIASSGTTASAACRLRSWIRTLWRKPNQTCGRGWPELCCSPTMQWRIRPALRNFW